MPRRSKSEKKQSGVRIRTEAARLFRQQGIGATSVADVMSRAEMTHGGFYRHFRSKDELVGASIDEAMKDVVVKGDDEVAVSHAEVRLFVERYLSNDHVRNLGGGCPFAALGPEIARGSQSAKQAAFEGAKQIAEDLGAGLGNETTKGGWAVLSTLVGAIVLARLSNSNAERDAILQAARELLDRQLG